MAIELKNSMSGDAFKAEVESALDKRGDAMVDGATLVLGKDPENDMEAVPKKYIDKNIKIIQQDIILEEGYLVPYEMRLVGRIKDFEINKYQIFIDNSYERSDNSDKGHYIKPIKINSNVGFLYTTGSWGSSKRNLDIKIDEQGNLYLGNTTTESYYRNSYYYSNSFSIYLVLIPCDYSNNGIEVLV